MRMSFDNDPVGNTAVGAYSREEAKFRPIKWFVRDVAFGGGQVTAIVHYYYSSSNTSGTSGGDLTFKFDAEEVRELFPAESRETPYYMVNLIGAMADSSDRLHKAVNQFVYDALETAGRDKLLAAEQRFLSASMQKLVRQEALLKTAIMSVKNIVCFSDVCMPSKGVRY